MKKQTFLFYIIFYSAIINCMACSSNAPIFVPSNMDTSYLKDLKLELKKVWPNNKIINLVFHGHSVPAGYFKTPTVDIINAYPTASMAAIAQIFPTATINSIRSCIGGENSTGGLKRFDSDALACKPDVLFIDYGLNDRSIGVEKAKANLEQMVNKALSLNIKVILLTPTPDLNEDITKTTSPLFLMAEMIRDIANKNNIGLVDSYKLFRDKALQGVDLKPLMSQNNHPNKEGHKVVTDEIVKFFMP